MIKKNKQTEKQIKVIFKQYMNVGNKKTEGQVGLLKKNKWQRYTLS